MSTKIYETIGTLNRSIPVEIEGRRITIEFKNGTLSPRTIQGRYSTNNVKVQEYLENNPKFNKAWRLVKVILAPQETQVFKAPPETTDPKTGAPLFDNPDIDDDNPDDDLGKLQIEPPVLTDDDVDDDLGTAPKPELPLKSVGEEVHNFQGARQYILQNCQDVKYAQLPNAEAVIKYAKSHNIVFSNWEMFK